MSENDSPYLNALHGRFTSALRWDDFERLWQTLQQHNGQGWYVYHIGSPPPISPSSPEAFSHVLDELAKLLREEHQEDYCGIVYADDMQAPGFVKIYDPNNLGSVCGPGLGPPPLPGWTFSLHPPVDLPSLAVPANRRRWWQRLLGRGE